MDNPSESKTTVKQLFSFMENNFRNIAIMSNFNTEVEAAVIYRYEQFAETFGDFTIKQAKVLPNKAFESVSQLRIWLDAEAIFISCTTNEAAILQEALREINIKEFDDYIMLRRSLIREDSSTMYYTLIIKSDVCEQTEDTIARLGITYYYI